MILHVLLLTVLSASSDAPADSVRGGKVVTTRSDSVAVPTLPAPRIATPVPSAVLPAEPIVRPIASRSVSLQPPAAVQQSAAAVSAPVSRPTPAAPLPVPVAAAADASAVALATRAPSGPEAPSTPAPAAPVLTADGRVVLSVRTTVTIEPLHAVPLPGIKARPVAPSIADSIVVEKRERQLTLFYRGVPVRSYFVALGARPLGDKERAGDQRTPEGLFHVNAHNPASKFHLALRISYPSAAHRARAEALGVDPGGDIMIHGLPLEFKDAGRDHVQNDWTNGCVALTNEEIEEIWRAVPDGTPVHIKP